MFRFMVRWYGFDCGIKFGGKEKYNGDGEYGLG